SAATSGATMAFVTHSEIIKRTVFPRVLLPIAVMLSHGINFLMASTVLLFFVPIFPDGFRFSPTLLLVPVILACMLILLAGVSLKGSVINVIYRHVAYLVEATIYL